MVSPGVLDTDNWLICLVLTRWLINIAWYQTKLCLVNNCWWIFQFNEKTRELLSHPPTHIPNDTAVSMNLEHYILVFVILFSIYGILWPLTHFSLTNMTYKCYNGNSEISHFNTGGIWHSLTNQCYCRQFFSKLYFSSPQTVIALSSTNGSFLPIFSFLVM